MLVNAIIGHRGVAGYVPENTLAGLYAAAGFGVGAVEFDVRLSRDGVVVLFHDDTLERTTNGHGAVADYDADALRALDAGGWFAPAFRGEPIPTLAEAIAVLTELTLAANVEIKAETGREVETAQATATIIARHWPADRPLPLLSSFRERCLEACLAAAPHLPRALLVDTIPSDWRERCRRLGCDAIHSAVRGLDNSRARAVVDAGTALRCYTVNDPDTAASLFARGVLGVFSDYPDRLDGPGPAR